jgi:hypothetical protein
LLKTTNEGGQTLNIIQNTIQAVQVGVEKTYKNLTVFPLEINENVEQGYLTLDEALTSGTVKITEVSDSGSVPELQFFNEGNQSVLLLDGEELVGAKQNRVLNLSILAPAQRAIKIPVSCVEQGRWAHNSSEFRSEDRVHFSRGRSAKAASVSRSMASGESRRSNQGEVWQNISEKAARFQVNSETDSMSDIYRNRKISVDEFVGVFSASEFQVGAVFCIDGAVAGIDLFDNPGTLRKLLSKLVRSYALDALETSSKDTNKTSKKEVESFIDIVTSTVVKEFPAVGLGEDLRLDSQMISGGALINEGRVIHLGVFPQTIGSSDTHRPLHSNMMRASHRRRTH